MEFIKQKTNINFLGKRYICLTISLLLIAASIYLWAVQGENKYGVDFRGGREIVVRFKEAVTVAELREAFEKQGFSEFTVQNFEDVKTDFAIKTSEADFTQEKKDKFFSTIANLKSSGYEIRKEEFVGPIVGEQIRTDGLKALFWSLVAMLIYIAFRFEWSFGVGGIAALFHDTIISTGACLLMNKQLSVGILAALLTIIGYSINDTIIIYDRIRENLNKSSKSSNKKVHHNAKEYLINIMNLSVNETLSRTILTSMTVLFVTVVLWIFGGSAVEDLSFALMVGIIVGTYSSVFIACPIVLMFQKEKQV